MDSSRSRRDLNQIHPGKPVGFGVFFFVFFKRFLHFKQNHCNFIFFMMWFRGEFFGGHLLIFFHFCIVPSSPPPKCFSLFLYLFFSTLSNLLLLSNSFLKVLLPLFILPPQHSPPTILDFFFFLVCPLLVQAHRHCSPHPTSLVRAAERFIGSKA